MTAFKAVLVALLAVNAVYFAVAGTASKAVDASAWLALLLLFYIETAFSDPLRIGRRRDVVRAARLVAGGAVVAAAIGYILEENLLDSVNSALWIAVVVMLEAEVRWPHLVARARRSLSVTAAVLYSGLGILVIAWAMRGQWFDAYDAALWLIAFVAVEFDVMRPKE